MSQLVRSVNTPSNRREGFSERSKIYAFVRTSPPQRVWRGTGKRNKRAGPQRRLALRPGGMVPQPLFIPGKVSEARAKDHHPGVLSTRRAGTEGGLRPGNPG